MHFRLDKNEIGNGISIPKVTIPLFSLFYEQKNKNSFGITISLVKSQWNFDSIPLVLKLIPSFFLKF